MRVCINYTFGHNTCFGQILIHLFSRTFTTFFSHKSMALFSYTNKAVNFRQSFVFFPPHCGPKTPLWEINHKNVSLQHYSVCSCAWMWVFGRWDVGQIHETMRKKKPWYWVLLSWDKIIASATILSSCTERWILKNYFHFMSDTCSSEWKVINVWSEKKIKIISLSVFTVTDAFCLRNTCTSYRIFCFLVRLS